MTEQQPVDWNVQQVVEWLDLIKLEEAIPFFVEICNIHIYMMKKGTN
jgi:hypothetical protein